MQLGFKELFLFYQVKLEVNKHIQLRVCCYEQLPILCMLIVAVQFFGCAPPGRAHA